MNTKKILELFLDTKKRISGIKDILLISEDGFPIISTLDTGEMEAKSTAAGAIICDAGQKGLHELDLGEIDLNVTIGTDGYFVIKRLPYGSIILVIAEEDEFSSPLGMILMKIKQIIPKIINFYEKKDDFNSESE